DGGRAFGADGDSDGVPVLARAIKKDLEEALPARLGTLARIGKTFRHAVEALPMGRKRRDFWADYYFNTGPKALEDGEEAVQPALETLLDDHLNAQARAGHIDFVGAGPGDPDLLTMKARRALDTADVVLYDRLVAPEILELARREATMIECGKTGFGPSMSQDDITALIIEHGLQGAHVVRLKSGDPAVFGRLEEEIDAVDAAGLSYTIVPGITAASGAVAAMGRSLTRRGRNDGLRFITGHDMDGFADHDWKALAAPNEVAAIYMAKRAARFVQGRLMMFGADAATPVTIVTNVSRADQQIIGTTLSALPDALNDANGPAILLYGLAPRAAIAKLPKLEAQA
ncbi:MAG: uroporphyrinogen-III C-methyltransferase, partial [Pseudomonadota bacterium]